MLRILLILFPSFLFGQIFPSEIEYAPGNDGYVIFSDNTGTYNHYKLTDLLDSLVQFGVIDSVTCKTDSLRIYFDGNVYKTPSDCSKTNELQNLTWDESVKILSISNGNNVDLSFLANNYTIFSGGNFSSFITNNLNATLYYNQVTNKLEFIVDNTDPNGYETLIDFTNWDTDSTNDLNTSTNFSGDVSGFYDNLQLGNGVVGDNELSSTTVASGSYTNANITVNSDGRITSASNGTNGDITAVNVSGYLTGGGTSGDITIGADTISTASFATKYYVFQNDKIYDPDTLSIVGNTLSISGGNSVTLPSGEATTVSDSPTIDLTLTGVDISAKADTSVLATKFDFTKLDLVPYIYMGDTIGAIFENVDPLLNDTLLFDYGDFAGNPYNLVPYVFGGDTIGAILEGLNPISNDTLIFDSGDADFWQHIVLETDNSTTTTDYPFSFTPNDNERYKIRVEALVYSSDTLVGVQPKFMIDGVINGYTDYSLSIQSPNGSNSFLFKNCGYNSTSCTLETTGSTGKTMQLIFEGTFLTGYNPDILKFGIKSETGATVIMKKGSIFSYKTY